MVLSKSGQYIWEVGCAASLVERRLFNEQPDSGRPPIT